LYYRWVKIAHPNRITIYYPLTVELTAPSLAAEGIVCSSTEVNIDVISPSKDVHRFNSAILSGKRKTRIKILFSLELSHVFLL
jgi:hypothetical protein